MQWGIEEERVNFWLKESGFALQRIFMGSNEGEELSRKKWLR
jgi:hypothetical protein